MLIYIFIHYRQQMSDINLPDWRAVLTIPLDDGPAPEESIIKNNRRLSEPISYCLEFLEKTSNYD